MIESVLNSSSKLQFLNRSKLPLIMQSEIAECGMACLAMIANYHGRNTSLVELRQMFQLSIQGLNLAEIMNISDQLHFSSRPLKIELNQLESLQMPCILHWNMEHFVVLKSHSKNKITIHDPAKGTQTLSLQEASQHFTGIALELNPTNSFERVKPSPSLKLSDFWSSVTGLKNSLLLVFLLSVLLQAFALASPYYLQLVIDDVVLTGDRNLLVVLAVGFSLVLLFEVITQAIRGHTLLQFSHLMNIQLGSNLFHHLIRLPITYFEKRHIGDVVSRFGSLQQIRQLLTTGIVEALIDGIMALVTLLMIFFYSPTLSFVVLTAISLYAITRIALYRPLKEVSEQEIRARAEEHSNFMETIRGVQTIKLYGSEVQRESKWQNHYVNTTNKSIKLGKLNISYAVINQMIFGLENIAVVYLAATSIITGGFSVGMLFAFMAYKGQFTQKTIKLVEKLIEFKMLSLHFERLADIVLTDKEKLYSDSPTNHQLQGKIELKDVSFRYSEDSEYIFNKLNMTISSGESIAISGPSGCGKTTLVKLMLGLNNVDHGAIYIDDIPLARIGQRQYRSQIAAVMQEDTLLSGTIAENIAFFSDDIDHERVVKCATLASVHEDITKMTMGYNSFIGDMGSSLSGGQKQRIILARALYKKPKILFLDEATSHLDCSLEATINRAINSLKITRIIIAHRPETIASADKEIKLFSETSGALTIS